MELDHIADEIFDMARSSDPLRITVKDLIECGQGGTILGILTDINDFLSYENRENQQEDED